VRLGRDFHLHPSWGPALQNVRGTARSLKHLHQRIAAKGAEEVGLAVEGGRSEGRRPKGKVSENSECWSVKKN